ncbi:MAG TPA: hypothetical protein PLF26_14550 [Blastocatellia bacterium]|nr:hypothetical protein [Blastocatellia bacterium]
MSDNGNNASNGDRDVLYLVGGAALLVLGVGLIAAHPAVRRTVSAGLAGVLPDLQGKLLPDLTAIGPDLQRYLRLRAM